MMRRLLPVLLGLLGLLGILTIDGTARAQEIQLTGPLAGAPAVRKLRLHREHRLEVAPTISFTLLDEFQRTILAGGRVNYNITDWFAIGVWGAFGAVHSTTALSDHIQATDGPRRTVPAGTEQNVDSRILGYNVGPDFKQQLGKIDWVASPQLTFIPFRGKLSIFQKIFVDTDLYLFAGPAFVGLTERADCNQCTDNFKTASRTAVTGSGGLGLTFYTGKWMSLGLEYRALPFAWNTGGFDNRGRDPNQNFPDTKISSVDREFKFNHVLSVSIGIYLPTLLKSSD
jgi:outer membrane beta-barrel protein